jgi:hypothetical protein
VVEVDPHDRPPDGGAADLLEPGVLEDLTGATCTSPQVISLPGWVIIG